MGHASLDTRRNIGGAFQITEPSSCPTVAIARTASRFIPGHMAERLAARVSGQALEVVRFVERGWDRHQDVWSYRNLDS